MFFSRLSYAASNINGSGALLLKRDQCATGTRRREINTDLRRKILLPSSRAFGELILSVFYDANKRIPAKWTIIVMK